MGINRRNLELFLWLRQQQHIPQGAHVVELGAQQLAHDALAATDLMRDLGRSFGVDSEAPFGAPAGKPEFDGIEEKLDPRAPPARGLWQWLGCDYTAIDIDGSPNSVPLDLNFDDVPASDRNKYHLVTNFGTTEHVANQLNAFRIAHDLTAAGGIMMHHLPSQGHLNHGLINYNPKFFWMLARSNEYRWVYFDYHCSATTYRLPQNIVESVARFDPDIGGRVDFYRTSNTGFIVILQKRDDAPYVPALDVPNDTRTDNQKLLQRYPTVLKPIA